MHLTDWWYSSFGLEETDEAKAIRMVINEIEKMLDFDSDRKPEQMEALELFREDGIREGLLIGMVSLVKDGSLTEEEAAVRASVSKDVIHQLAQDAHGRCHECVGLAGYIFAKYRYIYSAERRLANGF